MHVTFRYTNKDEISFDDQLPFDEAVSSDELNALSVHAVNAHFDCTNFASLSELLGLPVAFTPAVIA